MPHGKSYTTVSIALEPKMINEPRQCTDTILRIPKEQAALLPNRTEPITGDPDGYYIAQVDVFHQLHCLVRSRDIYCL